jgi:hypothetical protein
MLLLNKILYFRLLEVGLPTIYFGNKKVDK